MWGKSHDCGLAPRIQGVRGCLRTRKSHTEGIEVLFFQRRDDQFLGVILCATVRLIVSYGWRATTAFELCFPFTDRLLMILEFSFPDVASDCILMLKEVGGWLWSESSMRYWFWTKPGFDVLAWSNGQKTSPWSRHGKIRKTLLIWPHSRISLIDCTWYVFFLTSTQLALSHFPVFLPSHIHFLIVWTDFPKFITLLCNLLA